MLSKQIELKIKGLGNKSGDAGTIHGTLKALLLTLKMIYIFIFHKQALGL